MGTLRFFYASYISGMHLRRSGVTHPESKTDLRSDPLTHSGVGPDVDRLVAQSLYFKGMWYSFIKTSVKKTEIECCGKFSNI